MSDLRITGADWETKTVTMESVPEAEIEVSWQDVMDGRAYVELPLVSKLLLLHWAGAPWNVKAPDANLHALQVEVLAHKERQKIVEGGSRLGKSVIGGCEQICDSMLPNTPNTVIGQRYDHVGAEFQYVYKGLKTLFKSHPHALERAVFKHQSNYHDYDVATIWGFRCVGISVESDEGASLLGREFYRITAGEGSHISKMILEKRMLRALDGWLMQSKDGMVREGGYLSCYTTPKGFDGFSAAETERFELHERKHGKGSLGYGVADFATSFWFRPADVLENPFYDRTVYKARQASMSKDAFAEQYQGRKTYRTGRVLKGYHEDTHNVAMPLPELVREMTLGVGFDTGAYTGIIFGGIDRAAKFWALGEVYSQQQTINTAISEFRSEVVRVLGPIFETYDYSELHKRFEVWTVDPASQHKLEIGEELDIALQLPTGLEGGKPELLPTLDAMSDWYEGGRIHIVEDNCTSLVDQQSKYVWKTIRGIARGAAGGPPVKEPKKEYDHCIDAWRFLLLALHHEGPPIKPPDPVTFADAWRAQQNQVLFGDLQNQMREAEEQGGLEV